MARPPSLTSPMTELDRETVRAAQSINVGDNRPAARFVADMGRALDDAREITRRQRHAIYAIAWRYRRQLPVALQARIAIALAEAKATAELSAAPPVVEMHRPLRRANPLDQVMALPFPERAR